MIGVCVFFFALFLFSNTKIGTILLSLSTFLFAISFSFGETAKNVLNSWFFIFVRHAFDVGDHVVVPDIQSDMMTVSQIQLLNTTFRLLDNKLLTVPNYQLYSMRTINLRRSTNVHDVYNLEIDSYLSSEKISQFEAKLRDFLKAHPEQYDEKASSVLFESLYLQDKVVMRLDIAHVGGGQSFLFYPRRHRLIEALKRITDELQISNHGPTVFMCNSERENPNYKALKVTSEC